MMPSIKGFVASFDGALERRDRISASLVWAISTAVGHEVTVADVLK